MADAGAVRDLAARLRGTESRLLAATQDTPDILVKPTAEKISQILQALNQMASETSAPQPEQVAEMEQKEAQISELLQKFEAELAGEPWSNPPALRGLRETGDLLSTRIVELQRLRRKLPPAGPSSCSAAAAAAGHMPLPTPVAYAPAMASGGKKGNKGPMTVEDALEMLSDKKKVQYRGGLSGIVHAAGVMEYTAFQDHSPAKYEYTFAPKCQAAWNLHQFSAMM